MTVDLDTVTASDWTCTFRLPVELVKRLDAFAGTMAAPGVRVTRSDAVRLLLLRALDSTSSR